MQKSEQLQMIADFSNAFGPSGFEDEVVEVGRKYCPEGATQKEDHLRNLVTYRKEHAGNKPVVMLDGHSDEIGLMCQYVRPNGTLQFVQLGGFAAGCLAAHPFKVKTASGKFVTGLVSSKPMHFMTAAEKAAPPDESKMVVDVGSSSKAETEAMGIGVATVMAPDVEFKYIEDQNIMIGKAFDCRLGCAAVLGSLHELNGEDLKVDVVGAMSVQEEVGLRGAKVNVQTVKPDVAIVFEGCPADEPFTESMAIQSAIKRGPMLRHKDNGMITNARFQRLAIETAKEFGIPYQEAVRTGGATDGGAIHLAEQGIPTIVISIPVRYAHTHYGISSFEDWQNAVKLACAIIRKLDQETIDRL